MSPSSGAPSNTTRWTLPMSATTTTTVTGTTLPKGTNIWQWRSDMDMKIQQTYDLSGDIQDKGLYGGCWLEFNPETLAGDWDAGLGPVDQQFVYKGDTYGYYHGETGVTLLNKVGPTGTTGCIMRKSRTPIDLTVITRLELDIRTSGP